MWLQQGCDFYDLSAIKSFSVFFDHVVINFGFKEVKIPSKKISHENKFDPKHVAMVINSIKESNDKSVLEYSDLSDLMADPDLLKKREKEKADRETRREEALLKLAKSMEIDY